MDHIEFSRQSHAERTVLPDPIPLFVHCPSLVSLVTDALPYGCQEQLRRIWFGGPFQAGRPRIRVEHIKDPTAPNFGFLQKPAGLCPCSERTALFGTQTENSRHTLTVDGCSTAMMTTKANLPPWSPLRFSMRLQRNLCNDVQGYLHYTIGARNRQEVNSYHNFMNALLKSAGMTYQVLDASSLRCSFRLRTMFSFVLSSILRCFCLYARSKCDAAASRFADSGILHDYHHQPLAEV
jgi:hypothetical protein